VRNNFSVFVKNTVLCVKGDIELRDFGSTLHLRNEAQLVQGTTRTSANKGLGSSPVFQEGKSNKYRYNYCRSPIG
jgi:hypothetical protein